jgi:hypothetical protein
MKPIKSKIARTSSSNFILDPKIVNKQTTTEESGQKIKYYSSSKNFYILEFIGFGVSLSNSFLFYEVLRIHQKS